jgi:SPP1 gp7 family putative phage head morphogenesis protein
MKIDFKLRRRTILRPIVPTQNQEAELYSIYLDSVRIWANACAQISGSWSVLTTDDISESQIQWLINQAQQQSDHTIVYQTARLGRWVTKVGTWHGAKTISGIKSATGTDITPFINLGDVRDLLDRSIAQNVSLISSVNADTKRRIEQIIFDGFATRKTKKEITDQLAAAMGVTKRRARLIAGDQLQKINVALNGYRNVQLGIDSYIWKHTPQEHPRKYHVARNGKTFRWDDPPSDGPPGYAPNCRCYSQGIIDGEE